MEQEKADHKSSIAQKHRVAEHQLVGQVPKLLVSLTLLLIGICYFFLPPTLRIGPEWSLLAIEILLLIPMWQYWVTGHAIPHRIARPLTLAAMGFVTLALIVEMALLIIKISTFNSGFILLRSATLLWISNVLVFAVWYWNIDGGGPRKRHENAHQASDFLFPQQANGASWEAHFFDYLFVAFTGATAFSPTDTSPLSRRAKVLMMLEGLISFMIVAVLISRVANIF
ncbi:hypothetical protein KDH_17220 [Dictyobacter sp. S3.2.2.5]|uniref:DUF1345 domain-containing protein n=1 Tax=Dictyobacter halimunensis TaxID=3026934 RepID=A0ABQ6FKN3_9CHLR|nr:hypothetical protein KDH_16730 [Dictyobacter sp. S3.2.2.5]GLV54875.1 hypothetical protein KDH_17220 [Dictyobacter sp. S3.2.2.5]